MLVVEETGFKFTVALPVRNPRVAVRIKIYLSKVGSGRRRLMVQIFV